MKYIPPGKSFDVDEGMIPYFGRYGCSIKQAMLQKPVRFGYLITFNIYQGANSKSTEYRKSFGVGADTVSSLIDRMPKQPVSLFLDNYFTSPALFKGLTKRGYY